MSAPNPTPHDPYDKFSDRLRFAAQRLAKYSESVKRTVSRAPVEGVREAEGYGAEIGNQRRATGKAAKTGQWGAREAIARRDWEGAVRIGMGEVRRLLPGVKEGEAPQELSTGQEDLAVATQRGAPSLMTKSLKGAPNARGKRRRLSERSGSSPRPPKRRS